ncbi:uncharacterized protein METZ01_LOCUS354097, partial [marine metagenome]
PVNDAPTLDPIVDFQTIAEDSDTTIVLTASDVDNPELVFSAMSDNEAVTVSIIGDLLTITPEPDHFGSAVLTVIVSDGELTDSDTLALTINPVDDSPVVASSIGDISVDEDNPELTLADLDTVFQDVDGELTFEHSNDNEDFLTVSIHEVTHVVTVNFGDNENGTANLIFSATSGSSTVTDEVDITVHPVNDAPQLEVSGIPPFETTEDEDLNILLTASDVEDNPLVITAVSGPFHGTISTAGSDLIYSPDPGFVGNDNMVVQAVETGVEDPLVSNQVIISVEVFSENDAPVVTSFDWSVMEDGSTEILLQGYDADG